MKLPKHLLPPKLLEIAEYCGDKVAMLILEHFGGGHLYVPEHPDPLHKLTMVLGAQQAANFCQAFGREIIQVPKADKAMRAVRDSEIRELREQGESLFVLCRKFGLTERQVISICNKGEPLIYSQVDLFTTEDE